jgi:hypothetical protein
MEFRRLNPRQPWSIMSVITTLTRLVTFLSFLFPINRRRIRRRIRRRLFRWYNLAHLELLVDERDRTFHAWVLLDALLGHAVVEPRSIDGEHAGEPL